MTYFFCKLIPPRPTFNIDRTEEETALMREHVAYWSALAERGIAVAFGPVSDPAWPYGVGIVEVEDQAEIETLRDNDPTILSGRGFGYEIYGMPQLIVRKS